MVMNGNTSTSNAYPTHDLPYPVETLDYQSGGMANTTLGPPLSNTLSPIKQSGSPHPAIQQQNQPLTVPQGSSEPVQYPMEDFLLNYFQYRYEETVNDTKQNKKFTPYVQFQWCLALLQYSFQLGFVQRYNINCNVLPRILNDVEMKKNSTIILEHGIKVLSKLCDLKYGPAFYLMGCLYSHQLDLEFLSQFYENDPVARQIFPKKDGLTVYKKLCSGVQLKKILPLNDKKALEFYLESTHRTSDLLSITFGLYRSGVCLELGKGSDADLERAMELYELGWRDYKDQLCGYKFGLNVLKGKHRSSSHANDSIVVIKDAIKALHDVDTQQSLFELGKYYDNLGSQEVSKQQQQQQQQQSQDFLEKENKALMYYFRAAQKGYPLAIWKMGQIYEYGLLQCSVDADRSIAWYSKDMGFPLNLLALSGWLLTGGGSLEADEWQSFQMLERASTSGIGMNTSRIQYGMAIYYRYGIGCAVDKEKVRFYMTRAAKLGNSKAIEYLNTH
ncbi:hypothetical protein ACO0RG_002682 [Hanseniaspora osmophila]|uniref:Activator of C kinase protein 1 n=1 Tax=Hanseniaspora osmophila TaxID=56408 RepID=A0A1E5R7G0_9ASCO|nr:Activator of C kinase protein 1 [Hanseniaspora osmophila]